MQLIVTLLFSLLVINLNIGRQSYIEISDVIFIKISNNTYIAQYETSNEDYIAFLESRDDSKYQIHSDGWIKGNFASKSYYEVYFAAYSTQEKFRSHPVVNITQEAALEYCRYKTLKYNSNPNRKYAEVIFRLPSIKEWKRISFKMNKNDLDFERGKFAIPYEDTLSKEMDWKIENPSEDFFNSEQYHYLSSDQFVSTFLTCPVNYYRGDKPKIFHLYGNVSEWVSEKNIAIGGNFNTAKKSDVTNIIECESYEPVIGIRLIAEIIEY